jgi:hypothetical protein
LLLSVYHLNEMKTAEVVEIATLSNIKDLFLANVEFPPFYVVKSKPKTPTENVNAHKNTFHRAILNWFTSQKLFGLIIKGTMMIDIAQGRS